MAESLYFACNLICYAKERQVYPIISCTLLRNWHHVYHFLILLFLVPTTFPSPGRPRSLSSVRPKTQQLRETQFNCHVKTMWNGIDVIWLGAPRVPLPLRVRRLYGVSPKLPKRYIFDVVSSINSRYTFDLFRSSIDILTRYLLSMRKSRTSVWRELLIYIISNHRCLSLKCNLFTSTSRLKNRRAETLLPQCIDIERQHDDTSIIRVVSKFDPFVPRHPVRVHSFPPDRAYRVFRRQTTHSGADSNDLWSQAKWPSSARPPSYTASAWLVNAAHQRVYACTSHAARSRANRIISPRRRNSPPVVRFRLVCLSHIARITARRCRSREEDRENKERTPDTEGPWRWRRGEKSRI